MTIDLKDSASLLGSRICHDLISPLGAISNGLELLSMSGLERSPELQLIEESVANANARIQFFRVAFGASSGTQLMARPELLKLLDGCYAGGRIDVRWSVASNINRTQAKLAFLALLCVESALPQGGEISVQMDRGDWQVQGFGKMIRFDADVWSRFTRPSETPLPSSLVQFELLKDALAANGQKVQIGHSDSAVSMRF